MQNNQHGKSPEIRFWTGVNRKGPIHPVYGHCWVWKRVKDSDGYGGLIVNGAYIKAHRYSWEIVFEVKLSPEILVCHLCDNPICVRPSHLFLGDQISNQLDKVNKGRQATKENHGRAVLTLLDVRYIREHYIPRHKTYGINALARRFNVSPDTIFKIVHNITWKDV